MANTPLSLAHLSCQLLRMVIDGLKPLGDAAYVDAESHGPYGAKLGDTVRVRGPMSFDPWDLNFSTPQLFPTETSEMVVLQHQAKHEFPYDQRNITLNVEQFTRMYLLDAAESLTRQVQTLWPPGATLITALQPIPTAPTYQAQRTIDKDSGLSIRCVTVYDALTDTFHFRADILFGFTQGTVPRYVPSHAEAEMIALLLEARAQLATQLETLKLAA